MTVSPCYSRFTEGLKAGLDNDTCVLNVRTPQRVVALSRTSVSVSWWPFQSLCRLHLTDSSNSHWCSLCQAIRYAGHTVVLSGVTLIVAYAALLFFPVSFITSIGSGAMLVMASCLVVNMTLTPALLLAIPGLFRVQMSLTWQPRPRLTCRRLPSEGVSQSVPTYVALSSTYEDDTDRNASTDMLASPNHGDGFDDEDITRTLSYRYVSALAKRPFVVVVGLLLVTVPMLYFMTRFKVTASSDAIHPRDTKVWESWSRYIDTFPAGTAWPYVVVSEPASGNPNPFLPEIVVNKTNALMLDIAARTCVLLRTCAGFT